ncbi:hypothetical protein H2203_008319 [Taxawa tesnikishii (nom. ined.)]|nr:hypothetical protein H2203_008319 [Dothideales sp. JES 119]
MPSLYANLLDPKATSEATISGAPVKYEFKPQGLDGANDERKPADASLRFQPVKRPQVASNKPKPRNIPSSSSPDKLPETRKPPPSTIGNANSIQKWTAQDDDDDDPWAAEYQRRLEEKKEERKARRKSKKNKNAVRYIDWDAVYDPEKPTNPKDYKGSEEQAQAEGDWKQRLHAHQFKLWQKREPSEDEGMDRDTPRYRGFAPPTNYNFAPPAELDAAVREQPTPPADDDDDDYYEPPPVAYEPPPVATVYDDPTGEDAYARRMRMSGISTATNDPPPPTSVNESSAPPPQPAGMSRLPPPPVESPPPVLGQQFVAQTQSAPTPPAQMGAIISREPVRYIPPQSSPPVSAAASATISRAPSHGGLGLGAAADVPQDDEPSPAPDEDAPRSNRPGQKGFAKRLLQKYGWQEGEGLGATGSGITTALRHQTQKRKKRPDAEGGGWANPAAMGRIVGGKKRRTEDEEGGQWSIVVKLEGILDGVDVDHAVSEGNLMQQIGDKMSEYGQVERLFIDRSKEGTEPVFVKFTSALSAAGFFDAEKFEQGDYD